VDRYVYDWRLTVDHGTQWRSSLWIAESICPVRRQNSAVDKPSHLWIDRRQKLRKLRASGSEILGDLPLLASLG
jgi:hypothetical protein